MLAKQSVNLNFIGGIDTKTDPFQLAPSKFLKLQNSIFDTIGMLKKRNGFGSLPSLPDDDSTYLTTFNGNLTAIGNSLTAYNENSKSWINKGNLQPVSVNTLPLVRNNFNQIQCDSVIAKNSLICSVYTEFNGIDNNYKYTILDSITGQSIVNPTEIEVTSGFVSGSPRIFAIGNYFVIIFTTTISTVDHLQYISISINNTSIVTPNIDMVEYTSSPGLSWDGVVLGNNIYIGYNSNIGGQSVRLIYLTTTIVAAGDVPIGPASFTSQKATLMSLSSDPVNNIIWAAYYDSSSSTGYSLCVNTNLATILAPTEIISAGIINNITCIANSSNEVLNVYYQTTNAYGYDSGIRTDYISGLFINISGNVSTPNIIVRSVGLASKGFVVNGVQYFLSVYESDFQPTYFLINATQSLSSAPIVVSKIAYQNGSGYLTLGLPSVSVFGISASISYLFKDLIAAVNKGTNLPTGSQVDGIYSQTGINSVSFDFTTNGLDSSEIGNNLLISNGFLWGYDGIQPTENNFFLYPDNVEVATVTGSGGLTAQEYFYQITYEWTDNQGNAYRSAPSIPVSITTTTSSSTNTVNIPYLRLTYKIASPVKVVIYRWSAAQPIYYQVTSITTPQLNFTTVDALNYSDASSDAEILGNNIIYTNGGVLEDVSAPASNIMTLFDTRLWLVDSEDKNLLWFSKQVIEATPVEMSDLLTFYIAPNAGTTGSTGVITGLAPMDDKLIIFKKDAIYYINGIGPDNTGTNNQYSQPIFITSAVGCDNQKSITLMPNGLMFQSDKGIWLLGRDLSSSYIGADVEEFNSSIVTSSVNIPQTNQVRFALNTGQMLMYDYYVKQWATFFRVPSISSCIFQSLHTFIDSNGQVFQETPGLYLDGSNPVLISFTTSWINLASLQGFERFYWFYLLGVYKSPHLLNVQIAYNYVSTIVHNSIIHPSNFSSSVPSPFGDQPAPFGSQVDLEQWKVHAKIQKCQSFQITIDEVYDPSMGASAGAGFTLSGLNLVLGIKKSTRPIPARNTVG